MEFENSGSISVASVLEVLTQAGTGMGRPSVEPQIYLRTRDGDPRSRMRTCALSSETPACALPIRAIRKSRVEKLGDLPGSFFRQTSGSPDVL